MTSTTKTIAPQRLIFDGPLAFPGFLGGSGETTVTPGSGNLTKEKMMASPSNKTGRLTPLTGDGSDGEETRSGSGRSDGDSLGELTPMTPAGGEPLTPSTDRFVPAGGEPLTPCTNPFMPAGGEPLTPSTDRFMPKSAKFYLALPNALPSPACLAGPPQSQVPSAAGFLFLAKEMATALGLLASDAAGNDASGVD